MAGILGGRANYIYISDNTLQYTVNHSIVKANSGGFTLGVGAAGKFPYPVAYMRTVLGAIMGSGTGDSAPVKQELQISDPTFAIWVGGINDFSLVYSTTVQNFVVTGRRGERRYRLASE